MKDSDTKSKLGSSLSQQSFCPQFTSVSKCYLQQTNVKIKKYRAKHNLMKLDAAVQQLKQRYSIRSAAKQIGLNYSQLHKLLSFKTNSTRQVTIEDKQCVIETYSQNKITMQLPYHKYAKKHYLRCVRYCVPEFPHSSATFNIIVGSHIQAFSQSAYKDHW